MWLHFTFWHKATLYLATVTNLHPVDNKIMLLELENVSHPTELQSTWHRFDVRWLPSLGIVLNFSICFDVYIMRNWAFTQTASLLWCLHRQSVWTKNRCHVFTINYLNWIWEQNGLYRLNSLNLDIQGAVNWGRWGGGQQMMLHKWN